MKKSKLTLIKEKAKKSKDGRKWMNEYKCECGNTTFQCSYDIKHNLVRTCGCGMWERKNQIPSDSLLSLIEESVKNIDGKIYDKYLCKCGNIIIRAGVLVRSGATKSCGCLMRNPPNKKYFAPPTDSRLTLIKEDIKKIDGEWVSKYKCSCGKIKILKTHQVNCGETKSCGCLQKEKTVKHGQASHGKNTRIYTIWVGMRRRCREKKRYADRGITVCKEWQENFLPFYEWSMKNGYTNKLQIDRIDNDGNYEPSNCRWTTCKINSNNRISNLGKEKIKEIKILLEFGFSTGMVREIMGGGAVSHIRAIRDGKVHSDIKI